MHDLARIPSGTRVFVDTNIFVLGMSMQNELGQACHSFLTRIKESDLIGFTSTLVLSEVLHRVIINEARERFQFPNPKGTAAYLEKHPELVKQLTLNLNVASDIRRLKVDIRPIEVKDLHKSKEYRAKYGLMANDSLIAAFMDNFRLHHLATHDNGFKRVKELKVWMPIVNKAR